MKGRSTLLMFLAAAVLSPAALTGCGNRDDGLKPEEQKMATRLDEIVKKSGGDWNKLSPEDRDYLVKDISQGSEPSARMLLQAKAGRLQRSPGGPRHP